MARKIAIKSSISIFPSLFTSHFFAVSQFSFSEVRTVVSLRFGDVHDINFTVAVDVAIFHYDEGGRRRQDFSRSFLAASSSVVMPAQAALVSSAVIFPDIFSFTGTRISAIFVFSSEV